MPSRWTHASESAPVRQWAPAGQAPQLATLQQSVRMGVRTGVTLTATQMVGGNGLTETVKGIVQQNSLGLLSGSTGLSKTHVHYLHPPDAGLRAGGGDHLRARGQRRRGPDPALAAEGIADTVLRTLEELKAKTPAKLIEERFKRLRKIGVFEEGVVAKDKS